MTDIKPTPQQVVAALRADADGHASMCRILGGEGKLDTERIAILRQAADLIEALQSDKARLDWLSSRDSFAVWMGLWSELTNTPGQPVCDIHDLGDAEGYLGELMATGNTLREAIDAEMVPLPEAPR